MEPRTFTPEETREILLQHIRSAIDFWDRCPIDPMGPRTQKERLEGLAFSILALLDGKAGVVLPAFEICPVPHKGDNKYRKGKGENWFSSEAIGPLSHAFNNPGKKEGA
jgi:hypothetical protein